MRLFRLVAPLLCLAPFTLADLTQQQKVSDFQQLAALYDVNYGPYGLKIQLYNYDLLNLQPWLTQIAASKTDVDFYDICTRYVATLQDSHDEFTILSDYDAWMHMDADIYDGKLIITYIDRTYLPARTFTFALGDQIISVDGVASADLLNKLVPYSVNGSGNPVSQQRIAAASITERYQGWNPTAAVGVSASVVVQHADGTSSTYTIPWDVQGTLVTTAGLLDSPFSATARKARAVRRSATKNLFRRGGHPVDGAPAGNPWLREPDSNFTPAFADNTPDPEPPAYMKPLVTLGNMRRASPEFSISGEGLEPFGSTFPVFNPPTGFKLRLGSLSSDAFLSGTFPAGAATIGFIRIPSFAPTNTTTAVNQFAAEMAYFQANTDGLVVDIMGNGGGSLCYGQTLASYLLTTPFQGVTQQLRASLNWQLEFSESRQSAINTGAPAWVAQTYSVYLAAVKQALTGDHGMTGALPLCGVNALTNPATSAAGKLLAYQKPILVLTDNFTLSTAESFTMQLQDNKRATIFGTRTDGGGGNVVGYDEVTAYSQGSMRVTEGLLQRLTPVAANGFTTLPYYDSVGIQPDMVQDYMTMANFSTGGTPFVNAVVSQIRTMVGK